MFNSQKYVEKLFSKVFSYLHFEKVCPSLFMASAELA